MDEFIKGLNCAEFVHDKETFIAYAVVVVLFVLLVSWILASLYCLVKPLVLAALFVSLLRPDLVQKFWEEDCPKLILVRSKIIFFRLAKLLMRVAEKLHQSFS